MKFWNETLIFWLLILSWLSSAFSSGLLNTFHQSPRSIASDGLAACQPIPSAKCTGLSLYEPGGGSAVAAGWWYFGPTRHPARRRSIAQRPRREGSERKFINVRVSVVAFSGIAWNGLLSVVEYIRLPPLEPQPDSVKHQVNNRRRIERQHLAHQEPADDADPKRLP